MSYVRAGREGPPPDGGFSLIEVVFAVVVFAIAAAGTAEALVASLAATTKNQQRVAAADLAAKQLETIRDATKNSVALPASSDRATTVDGTTYQIAITSTWVDVGATGSSCTGAVPGTVAYRRVMVSVTWPHMTGTPALAADSVVTPLNPDTITIPVQLVDAQRNPLPGQTVTLAPQAGGSPQSQITDDNGCVTFAQLAPAKYSVAVNTAGYVDTTSAAAQSHTEPVGQTTPGMTPVTVIFYDRPASLAVSPQFSAGYPLPSSGLSYTVQQTGWTDGSSRSFAASAFPLAVFPFATAPGSGYSMYAGRCTDSKPTPIPGTSLGDPGPGGSTTVNVPFVSLNATFQKPLLNLLGIQIGLIPLGAGYTIKLADSTAGCTEQLTLSGTTSSGSTLAFSVPVGTYTVTATKGSSTLALSGVSVTSSGNVTWTVS